MENKLKLNWKQFKSSVQAVWNLNLGAEQNAFSYSFEQKWGIA